LSSSQLIKLTELSRESDLTRLSWVDLSQLNSTLKLNLSWVEQLKPNNRPSFNFDLWRNFFRKRDDETKIKSEIEYLSSKKTRCLWLCDTCSFSLSLWNMWYKFFTNKHDLIDESREELQDESLERVSADESQDKRIENERIKNERIDES